MMREMVKKVAGVSLSLLVWGSSLGLPAVALADTGLQQVKKEENQEAAAPAEHKTMKERIAELKAQELAGDAQKTEIPAGEAYIPKDTQLTVELTKELSSKTNRKGESIQFKLVDNMLLNDVVVIPAGTIAEGHITKQKSSGMFGRAGKLEISVDSIQTVNGVTVPLTYVGRIEAGSDGAVAVAALVSLVGGLFMKGANVKIPAGTKIAAKVEKDTDLQTTIKDLAAAMDPSKPRGVKVVLPQ